MEDNEIEKYLEENQKCFDRFTFDKVFRFLLSSDFSHENAKDLILCHCLLSALTFEERIYNDYYKKITASDSISEDLQQLKNEIYNAKFHNPN